MRPQFALFQSHLDLAHKHWKELVEPNDLVVDATCGNGHDAAYLASLVPQGKLILFDIQQEALQKSAAKIKEHPALSLHQMCHSRIDEVVPKLSAKLIVFNFGYLPGQDKSLTTMTHTSLASVKKCLDLITFGGGLSLTCYPGHEEGKKELEELLAFCKTLSPQEWSVCHTVFLNRSNSPELLLLQKQRSCDK